MAGMCGSPKTALETQVNLPGYSIPFGKGRLMEAGNMCGIKVNVV